MIGKLRSADASLRRSIALSREIDDERDEAVGHLEFGRLLAFRGYWSEAERELATALNVFGKQRELQAQSVAAAYHAHRALLMCRVTQTAANANTLIESAFAAARRALDLADETARTRYPHARDYVRANWVLGAAYRAKGELDDADRHLTDSLTRCRTINNVEEEPNILLELARLRRDQGRRNVALDRADEALLITERSSYVLQGADVHLLLAQFALDVDDRPAALEHAQEAHTLATCDGPPDYTYKVAYDEAAAMLELQPAPDEP
jgi:tetratricopeptide (TPR) repeat protein